MALPLIDTSLQTSKLRQSNWRITVIVVKNGRSCGVSIFFPGTLAHGRTFKVVDLTWAKRYALLRTIFHLVMIALIIFGSRDGALLRALDVVTLCYVVLYTAFVKRVSISVAEERVTYSLAPVTIWLAHFSYFGLLLVCLLLSINYSYPPANGLVVITVLITMGVALFLVAPIWAYIVYKRESQHV